MFALLGPFMPLIWRAVAGVAFIVAVWWAWAHFVADPYIAQGAAKEHVITVRAEASLADAQAANKSYAADFKALQDRYQNQGTAVAVLAKKETTAKAATKAAQAALETTRVTTQTEIDQLRAIAAQPPAATKDADCEDARQLINDAAAHRVRG